MRILQNVTDRIKCTIAKEFPVYIKQDMVVFILEATLTARIDKLLVLFTTHPQLE